MLDSGHGVFLTLVVCRLLVSSVSGNRSSLLLAKVQDSSEIGVDSCVPAGVASFFVSFVQPKRLRSGGDKGNRIRGTSRLRVLFRKNFFLHSLLRR